MSNHHIVYFETYNTMLYVNYILIKLGKKECKFHEDRDSVLLLYSYCLEYCYINETTIFPYVCKALYTRIFISTLFVVLKNRDNIKIIDILSMECDTDMKRSDIISMCWNKKRSPRHIYSIESMMPSDVRFTIKLLILYQKRNCPRCECKRKCLYIAE